MILPPSWKATVHGTSARRAARSSSESFAPSSRHMGVWRNLSPSSVAANTSAKGESSLEMFFRSMITLSVPEMIHCKQSGTVLAGKLRQIKLSRSSSGGGVAERTFHQERIA